MLLALFADRARQFHQFGHFETNFVLDDFEKRDVRRAHIPRLGDEGPAQSAGAGVELPDTAGNQIDQNVGITNFLQCFSSKFSVQCVIQGKRSSRGS